MGRALVQGASRGIGLGLTRLLLGRGDSVVATCRNPASAEALRALSVDFDDLEVVALDVTDEETIEAAARRVSGGPPLDLVVNAAGLLHEGDMSPERRLEEVDPANLLRSFQVNAIGPILVAKHFIDLLAEDAVFATISARVGSIEDNRLGGWYSYRASKAAQNMLTKNLAIELTRRRKAVTVLALHPGTVDTDLSKPFQRSVRPEKLFAVERASVQLLDVIEDARAARRSGAFLAWDGQPIPW